MTTSPIAGGALAALRATPVPLRMRKLPTDARGYPVPKFVHWHNGTPDFRVLEPAFLARCIKFKMCWICGEPLGAWKNYVVGPMCIVNRTSSEPPSHYDCAAYACKVCPFLAMPRMHRRDTDDIPHKTVPGFMIARNPGVAVLWTTRHFEPFRPSFGGDGVLFNIGEPHSLEWYERGQAPASDEAIAHSFRTGLPTLIDMAQREGVDAVLDLRRRVWAAALLTPSHTLPDDVLGLVP